MNKDFEKFMSQLSETNATLGYYSDFNKIRKNVNEIAISLKMLNFLLGKDDLREAVTALWKRDKRAFEVLDILIATRRKDKKKFIGEDGKINLVSSLFTSIDGVMKFLEETGLAEVFKRSDVHDLVDYVFGVETGLDSNARKNRSGKITEMFLHHILETNGIEHRMEVYSREFPEIKSLLGEDEKRFDFVIKTRKQTYLIELNFYSGGGSKPNEVARAYRELAPIVNNVDGFEFVWITDGEGWNSAKSKLAEAYNEIPRMYNFTTLPEFLNEIKSEM
ncbi:MAG: type II restriction endonuclease [Paludibacteraceae bacterium]|nr:type II restriction endonuclease [Paludibacteraceae bacterium]